jgi:hypothetical protein
MCVSIIGLAAGDAAVAFSEVLAAVVLGVVLVPAVCCCPPHEMNEPRTKPAAAQHRATIETISLFMRILPFLKEESVDEVCAEVDNLDVLRVAEVPGEMQ